MACSKCRKAPTQFRRPSSTPGGNGGIVPIPTAVNRVVVNTGNGTGDARQKITGLRYVPR